MTKKYVPSGYQIINVNVLLDEALSKYYIEESADSLLLKNLLISIPAGETIKKPILLNVNIVVESITMCGFVTSAENVLTLKASGYECNITIDGDNELSVEIVVE